MRVAVLALLCVGVAVAARSHVAISSCGPHRLPQGRVQATEGSCVPLFDKFLTATCVAGSVAVTLYADAACADVATTFEAQTGSCVDVDGRSLEFTCAASTEGIIPAHAVRGGRHLAAGSVKSVLAYGDQSCALLSTGLRCWGNNVYGQLGLGLGSSTLQLQPPTTDLTLISPIGVVGLGEYHTCASLQSGGLTCWGFNSNGQLGTGNTALLWAPTSSTILPGLNILQISGGQAHTCVLIGNPSGVNTVRCWGANGYGQLGVGNYNDVLTPPTTDLPLNGSVASITTGWNHTCVLYTQGSVSCWGSNLQNQLGYSTRRLNITYSRWPVPVGVNVSAISAGYFFTCALNAATNYLRCWGDNTYGQLGSGTYASNNASTAVELSSTDPVASFSAGAYHVCVVSSITGGVRCWGRNDQGELGLGNTYNYFAPPPADIMLGGLTVVQVAAGEEHTCVLTSAGGVRCWGEDLYGQLGTSVQAQLLQPPLADLPFNAASSVSSVTIAVIVLIVIIVLGGMVAYLVKRKRHLAAQGLSGQTGAVVQDQPLVANPGAIQRAADKAAAAASK